MKENVCFQEIQSVGVICLFLGFSYSPCLTLTSHWYGNHNGNPHWQNDTKLKYIVWTQTPICIPTAGTAFLENSNMKPWHVYYPPSDHWNKAIILPYQKYLAQCIETKMYPLAQTIVTLVQKQNKLSSRSVWIWISWRCFILFWISYFFVVNILVCEI